LHGSAAEYVVREVIESAVKMARLGLSQLGASEQAIKNAEAVYRERDAERLGEQASSGDFYAARDRIVTSPQVPPAEGG